MISREYREIQSEEHESDATWGTSSSVYADHVTQIINKFHITDMLDYGAGKGALAKNIHPSHKIEVSEYDPCIEHISASPCPHELVTCTDVLEHIEQDYIYDVLNDLKRVTEKFGYFSVSTVKAKKVLSDGRNAHLIVEQLEWWLPKIMSRFMLRDLGRGANGFFVFVEAINEH